MDVTLEPGRYVAAVSGGVDSVVLLHLLRQLPDVQVTVAHFDHGIRPDSADDRQFVKQLAESYGTPYIDGSADLGPDAGEAAARQARYEFLYSARTAVGAQAIVTAHHQDDALETAVLNIIRGTNRRGLSSLRSTDIVKRPLLHVPKADIIRYARANRLEWREDSTNAADIYRRNYVRHHVVPRIGRPERQRLQSIISELRRSNAELDRQLDRTLADYLSDGALDRRRFIMLPHAVCRELMAAWLRSRNIGDIDRKLLEMLVRAAKTFPAGRRFSINHNYYLLVRKNDLALVAAER